jgi:hypothetical protein
MQPGERPRPFCAFWPRGGAKSTSAELLVAALGVRGIRRYCIYVCETQDQADKHVQAIATILETIGVERAVNKYGAAKGWNRTRLRTSGGFTLEGYGLDVGTRGIKMDDARPDLIVFDDIDGRHDNPGTTKKKIEILTQTVLPAGSIDSATLFIQNLIHKDSIASRLADGRADFLSDRIISGPYPAVIDLEVEQRPGENGVMQYIIVGGTPTWEGQDLEACQGQIKTFGYTGFIMESQQEVDEPEGGIFSHLEYTRCNRDEVPDLVRIVVWCDPAISDTDDSDSHGIQADGIDARGMVYRLWSYEQRDTPLKTIQRAIQKAAELGADTIGIETDQGGDTWESVIREAWRELSQVDASVARYRMPKFKSAKAGGGHGSKVERAQRMLTQGYEQGRITHVRGTHTILERAQRRFPKKKPFDLCDAGYWSWADVTGQLEDEEPQRMATPTLVGAQRVGMVRTHRARR